MRSQNATAGRTIGIDRGALGRRGSHVCGAADWRRNARHHVSLDVCATEVDPNDEQPELFLLAAIPCVRHLVIAILVAGVHPHRNGLRRYHFETYTRHQHKQFDQARSYTGTRGGGVVPQMDTPRPKNVPLAILHINFPSPVSLDAQMQVINCYNELNKHSLHLVQNEQTRLREDLGYLAVTE